MIEPPAEDLAEQRQAVGDDERPGPRGCTQLVDVRGYRSPRTRQGRNLPVGSRHPAETSTDRIRSTRNVRSTPFGAGDEIPDASPSMRARVDAPLRVVAAPSPAT